MRSRKRRILNWVIAFASFVLVGCGSKGSVALSGDIRDPGITVEQRELGTFVSAELSLFVEVGAYAPGSATLKSASFSIVESQSQAQVEPGLDMTPDRSFPIELGKGKSVLIHFASGTASEPAGEDLLSELCAGAVELHGEVSYELQGEDVLNVRSPAFSPDGC